MSDLPTPVLTSKLVSEHTIKRLQELLRDGTFEPGDKLPGQRELAAMLHISRNSLREAISVLETVGLVKVEVSRGVFVSKPAEHLPKWRFPSVCSPQEVYDIRYCIEPYACGLATRHLKVAQIDRLEESALRMNKASKRGDLVELARFDKDFHDTIIAACNNVLIVRTYESIRAAIIETQRIPMFKEEMLTETPKEHFAIIRALKASDATSAENAMKTHILGSAMRADITLSHLQKL